LRHHDYTHNETVPGAGTPGLAAVRDICRWHVEELAYLLGKLKSVREADGTLLDHTTVLFVHEHAEANPHKNTGHGAIVAGRAGRLRAGQHTRVAATFGDLYLTLANRVFGAGLAELPTADVMVEGIWDA
jgi:hypothetical protein